MHDMMLKGFNKTPFEKLMEELSSVKDDIRMIQNMEVSEEAKALILAELEKQVNEVKEKMHNHIDSL